MVIFGGHEPTIVRSESRAEARVSPGGRLRAVAAPRLDLVSPTGLIAPDKPISGHQASGQFSPLLHDWTRRLGEASGRC